MKRQLTPEEQAKAAERKARFRALVKQVSHFGPEEKAAFNSKVGAILTADGGHIGGLCNTMLICLQMPQASIVGGFRQWLKHGRAVMKGQHGAMIWVPIGTGKGPTVMEPEAADSEGTGEKKFIIGTVFDISQTQEIQTA